MRLLSVVIAPFAVWAIAACSASGASPSVQPGADAGGGASGSGGRGGDGAPGAIDASDDGASGPPAADASSGDDASADSGSSVSTPGWTLVFDDEFNGPGPGLDPSKDWQVYSGAQANAPDFSHFEPSEVYVENGVLRLRIEQKTVDNDPYACGGLEVPAAMAQTSGRWVVRARFPAGTGNVGYMGLFGQTYPPEIDFGEVAGKTPTVNTFTQHYGNDMQDQYTWTAADSTAGFHEYTVIWDGGTLTWLVDGVQQYQTQQQFTTQPMIVAMGDWAAPCSIAWAGCPDGSTVYPAFMDVDYVRIYQKQ
jgi:beta-glucanase (GH16 family)